MEWLDAGDVDQLNVVSDLDADSSAGMGDDFIWALVFRMERWFHSIYLDIDPSEVWDRWRWRRNNLRADRQASLQLVELVKQVLAVELQGVEDGSGQRTSCAIEHLGWRDVVIIAWSVPKS